MIELAGNNILVNTATVFRSIHLGVVAVVSLLGTIGVYAEPMGDCSDEATLATRDDIVMCEPWESGTWWADNGYVRDGALPAASAPAQENQMDYTSVVATGCKSGQCLKVDTPLGITRSLSIHWPISNAGIAPEELYFRYYFKIGADWTANACDAEGNQIWPPSGKFWGFADARVPADPGGQCGNGGASSDGINCWSARGNFYGCSSGLAAIGFPYDNTCAAVPNARLRLGNYIYVPDNGTTHGAPGFWDSVAESNNLGDDYSSPCRRDDPDNPDPNCYCKSANNMYCGIGSVGQLEAERWYAIETYVKMNTPGVADGILRGWVDDVLAYEKTNMQFRNPGHDNLHVRTLWLNTYKGGSIGNCENSELYYDQLVIATQRIGALDAGPRPKAIIDLE